jgi:hypothetical protein
MIFAKAILVVAMLCATFLVGSIALFVTSSMLSPVFLIVMVPYVFIWAILLTEGL